MVYTMVSECTLGTPWQYVISVIYFDSMDSFQSIKLRRYCSKNEEIQCKTLLCSGSLVILD